MPTAYAEEADVRKALQKQGLTGSIASEFVQAAIHAASDWFARQTNGHWFDSGGGTTLVDTSAASASDVILDVPSSPHAQDRHLVSSDPNVRYPVTRVGPYAELPLPHLYVTSITALNVRDSGGDVEDWVAGSQTSGVGEDYYLQTKGQNSYGRTYLRIHTGTMPALTDYGGALTVAYDYGLDYQTTPWDDVKRGVAFLAAAEVMSEDGVIAQIPDNGQLVGVETQHSQLVSAADNYLREYISVMGDNR